MTMAGTRVELLLHKVGSLWGMSTYEVTGRITQVLLQCSHRQLNTHGRWRGLGIPQLRRSVAAENDTDTVPSPRQADKHV